MHRHMQYAEIDVDTTTVQTEIWILKYKLIRFSVLLLYVHFSSEHACIARGGCVRVSGRGGGSIIDQILFFFVMYTSTFVKLWKW